MIMKQHFDDWLSEQMQKETKTIIVKGDAIEQVMDKIRKKDTPFNRFLEKEIIIPLGPVLAATAIFFITLVLTLYPLFKITEKDIQENRIYIIESTKDDMVNE